MTTPSNTMPGSDVDSQVIAPAAAAAIRPIYWSIRRELWEYRAIYLAPLGLAAVFLFGFLIYLLRLPSRMSVALTLDPMQQHEALAKPYDVAAAMIMGAAFLVGLFYCLEALHSERRDRSILFWKSLPVSDLTTVLAKASIPIVVLQLLTIAITVVTQWIMLLLSSAVVAMNGLSVTTLWRVLSVPHMSWMLTYHLLTVHALWYAPIYAWLLLISGWARRAPFLWAFLPPLAVGVAEKIAFNTSHFAHMVMYRVSGPETFAFPGMVLMDPMSALAPLRFLSTPGLWTGLAAAAVFLALAVRLRRYREPI
jgi:ABC-2 type transport system permease protein